MNSLKNILVKVIFKIVKCRDGSTKGPLPSMTNFTDYSTHKDINMYWFDKCNSVSIVRKHIRQVLEYYGYSDRVIEKALIWAKIEKYKRTSFRTNEKDEHEYIPGFAVTLKFDK